MADVTVTEAKQSTGTKTTHYRWFVLFLIFVMYTMATADRANIGVAMPYIRKDFAMSNTEAGAIMSLFFLGYVIAMIPGGFLNRKFGIRVVFSSFMIGTSIFTGLIGIATSILQLKIFRLGVGLAEGPLSVAMPSTINNWFPPREKGIATSTFIAASKFGPLMVPPLCAVIILAWGWHWVFLLFAIPGCFFSIIWFLMVPNSPAESRFCSQAEADYIMHDKTPAAVKETKPKKPYDMWWLDKLMRAKVVEPISKPSRLFLSWNMVGSALSYFFLIAITTTMMSWLPTYLLNVKKMAIMSMAFASAAPFAGAVVGNVIGGWVSDYVIGSRRKPMIMISAITTCFTMYSLINAPNDPFMLGLLLFVTGVLLSLGFAGPTVYAMGLVTKELFPVATAITNTCGQMGGFLTPLAIGVILDYANWDAVFMMLAAGCAICFLLLLTIDEPVKEVCVRKQ